jgi:hypothetical protein
MNVMDACSPVPVTLRQVSFRPDADIRTFLDTYVPQQGYEIKGFIQRLIRDEMTRVQESAGGNARPKASGRKDVARRAIAGRGRELVPIEDIYPA